MAAREFIEGRPGLVVLPGDNGSFAPLPGLIASARSAAVPVIWATTPTTPEAPAAPVGLRSRSDEAVIRVRRHSIFFGTDLSIIVGDLGIQTLILAGGVTSIGVHYSFLDAHQNDLFCRVAQDCITGVSPAAHEGALRAMEYMQTGARSNAVDIEAALRGAARSE